LSLEIFFMFKAITNDSTQRKKQTSINLVSFILEITAHAVHVMVGLMMIIITMLIMYTDEPIMTIISVEMTLYWVILIALLFMSYNNMNQAPPTQDDVDFFNLNENLANPGDFDEEKANKDTDQLLKQSRKQIRNMANASRLKTELEQNRHLRLKQKKENARLAKRGKHQKTKKQDLESRIKRHREKITQMIIEAIEENRDLDLGAVIREYARDARNALFKLLAPLWKIALVITSLLFLLQILVPLTSDSIDPDDPFFTSLLVFALIAFSFLMQITSGVAIGRSFELTYLRGTSADVSSNVVVIAMVRLIVMSLVTLVIVFITPFWACKTENNKAVSISRRMLVWTFFRASNIGTRLPLVF